MLAKKAKEVLDLLQEQNLLKNLILIGSWCCHFYISYFGGKNYVPTIQTIDMDLLIPDPKHLKLKPISLPNLLKGLDFDSEIDLSGWLRFLHPELRVEFLIPRLGPATDDPRKIPQLEITAMPLRHTHVLTAHTIKIEEDGLSLRLPHPLSFALHKLFISSRRREKGKAIRDKEMALRILAAAQMTGKTDGMSPIWASFTKKEQKVILDVIKKEERENLIPLLIAS